MPEATVLVIDDNPLDGTGADFAGDVVGRRQTRGTGHGRRESRTYLQLEAPERLLGFQARRGLKSIGVVISEASARGSPWMR